MSIRTRLPLALAAAALLAVTTLPAAAQWKWRDANGRVTLSDTPPPRGVPDRDILQRPAAPRPPAPNPAASAPEGAPPPAAPASAPGRVDRELEARRRAAEQERLAKLKTDEQAQAQQRAENCRRARSQLQLLDSGQRIARMNDKGEREFLDDAARAAEARKAREVVASDCR